MDALKPPASTENIRKNCAASPQGKIVLRGGGGGGERVEVEVGVRLEVEGGG
jgi:hypothetical protein